MPFADKGVRALVKLCNPLTTRAMFERFCDEENIYQVFVYVYLTLHQCSHCCLITLGKEQASHRQRPLSWVKYITLELFRVA